MPCRIPTRLFAALLVAGAVACTDSAAPRAGVTDAMLTSDVGRDAAQATAQDLAQMAEGELLIGMPLAVTPSGSTSVFGNCAWDAAVSLYVCPAITIPGGLTLTRYFEIFAGGSSQRTYDAVATDSVLFHATLAGTLAEADRTAWLSESRFLMVSGLGGTETQRTWRGAALRDDSVHVKLDGAVRTTYLLSSDVIDNVVFKLPRAEFPFPQSGTVTRDVSVSSVVPDGTEATNRRGSRHVVITFNGTRTASVVVDTTPCALDLVTRKLTCS